MKLSIAAKINLYIGILIVIAVVFLGWFFIRHESRAIANELFLRGRSIVENIALNSESPLLFGDKEGLEKQLEKTAKKDILYIEVEDMNGELFVSVGNKTEGPAEIFTEPVVFSKPQTKEDAIIEGVDTGEQKGEEEIIGKVILGVSLDGVEQRTAQLVTITLTVLAVVIVLFISGAFLGFKYLIDRPLKNLVGSIEAIGAGELSHRVEVKTGDEIGKLADSFNMMTENLSKVMVSKDYVNNILESLNDMLIVFSSEGFIKTANRAAQILLGYGEKELIGKSYTAVLHAEDLLFNESKLQDIINKDIIYRDEEKIFIRKDGTRFPVSFFATFMYDNSGITQGIICVAQDITGKKRDEAEKRRLEKRLLLAEKMEALGRLAGGVAHDLNNTLGAIVGYPDLLLRKLPEDSKHKKAIWAIKKSGQKAAAIVRDLLTLARRGIPITDVVNLNDIVDEYVSSAEIEKLLKHFPGARVEVDLEKELLNIKGSPVHLAKTVMNLVSNAVEAVGDKGTVTVSTSNRYVDKAVESDDLGLSVGEYSVLEIADTGVGIPPEDLKLIFEPFFTRKKMGRSGTGLGMAVVWGTVKDHNGYIDVKSIPEKGTIFTLYFPVTRQEAEIEKKPVSMEEYMGNGEKILVVDDIPEQREISAKLLRNLGYSVDTVPSGEEAIRYLENHTVDLLILDMIMDPGMDGLDTYKWISELYPGTKAIIASGFSETKRVKEAQKHGAGAYVQKPYTLEKIGLAVKKELSAGGR